MKELKPNLIQQKLIDQLNNAGGVIDYVILESEECDKDSGQYERHYQAVIEAMNVIKPRNPYYKITLNYESCESLTGRKISHKDFLGECYDFDQLSVYQVCDYDENTVFGMDDDMAMLLQGLHMES